MNATLARRIAVLASAAAVGIGSTSCSTPKPDEGAAVKTSTASEAWNYATTSQVLAEVKAAEQLTELPDVLTGLIAPDNADNRADGADGCFDRVESPDLEELKGIGRCAYGDRKGTKLMVAYGDSRAWMWSAPLERIAKKFGWKLRVFSLGGCPAVDLSFQSTNTKSPNTQCDTFHEAAISKIQSLRPQLVITTSGSGGYKFADGSVPTLKQLHQGMLATYQKLARDGARLATIESIPTWNNNDERCLNAHVMNIQRCSIGITELKMEDSEPYRTAAAESNAVWIPTTQWVCADRCEPVIANTQVYRERNHFSKAYTLFLTAALNEALQPAMA